MKASITVLLFTLLFSLLTPFCCPAEVQNGLKYYKMDGYVAISGYEIGVKDVVIPEEIDGLPVRRIDDEAFRSCSSLRTVVLPGSLQKTTVYDDVDDEYDEVPGLGWAVFRNCVGLESVTLSSGNRGVSAYSFEGCPNLKEIRVPENNHHLSSVDGVLFNRDGTQLLFFPPGKGPEYTVPDCVTVIEEMAFYKSTKIKSVTFPKSLTKIGRYAFQGCSALTSVQFPENLKIIESEAFHGCSSLTSIQFSESLELIGYRAFMECSSLTTVVIPEKTAKIDSGVFDKCTNLTSVTLPKSLSYFNGFLFSECPKLESLTIPESVTTLDRGAFDLGESVTTVTIPAAVTKIGVPLSSSNHLKEILVSPENQHFKSVDGVLFSRDGKTLITYPAERPNAEYVVPADVTEIQESAFRNCRHLTSVVLPEGLTQISSSTFSGCAALTSVTIPKTVTKIEYYAFPNCKNLSSLTIPERLEEIGAYAFSGCFALKSLTIPNRTRVERSAFDKCTALTLSVFEGSSADVEAQSQNIPVTHLPPHFEYELKDGHAVVTGYAGRAETLTIPESFEGLPVTEIAFEAFSGHKTLKNVTLPSGLKHLGTRAFANCEALEEIVIPDGTEEIGEEAFAECKALKTITIPASVVKIGKSAFRYCSLKNITVPKDSEAEKVLQNCGFLKVFKPIPAYSEKTLDGIRYKKREKDVLITGSDLKNVVIPTEIEGLPVTEIAEEAFKNKDDLETVTIPEGVTKIGKNAFYYCKNLKTVTIPESVTDIGTKAFGFSGLTSVTIPESVRNIETEAFSCSVLTSVTIPKNITEIKEGVFDSCRNLTSVTISEGVRKIDSHAFAHCYSLPSITIPASVTEIGARAFAACTSLKTVTLYSTTRLRWVFEDMQKPELIFSDADTSLKNQGGL